MERIRVVPGLVFLLLVLVGVGACAPNKSWKSEPTLQKASSRYVEVSIEPLKEDQRFFVWFRLQVKNVSNVPISIDWNQTLYLFEEKKSGVFVFEGIDPASVKEKRIPADVIPAGEMLTKKITPYQLVAIAPLRDRNVKATGSGISPGLLPEGRNGILLAVDRNGQVLTEKLEVEITAISDDLY